MKIRLTVNALNLHPNTIAQTCTIVLASQNAIKQGSSTTFNTYILQFWYSERSEMSSLTRSNVFENLRAIIKCFQTKVFHQRVHSRLTEGHREQNKQRKYISHNNHIRTDDLLIKLWRLYLSPQLKFFPWQKFLLKSWTNQRNRKCKNLKLNQMPNSHTEILLPRRNGSIFTSIVLTGTFSSFRPQIFGASQTLATTYLFQSRNST